MLTTDGNPSRVADFGQLPRGTHSGLIDRVLASRVLNAPSLVLIQAAHDPIPRSFLHGPYSRVDDLHVQTFDSGHSTIIHCFTRSDNQLFRFSPHSMPWVGLVELETNPYERWLSYGTFDERTVDGPLTEDDLGQPGWIELSFFEGEPLPFILLNYIFEQSGLERFPARGRRGMVLSSHIWKVVNCWYEGVQHYGALV